MFGFLIFIHVITCILLATVILMQSGRGGGLTDNFAGAESLFGAKTNIVLVRTTAVLATIFIVTSLSLAFISARSGKSLINESVMAKNKSTIPSDVPFKEGSAKDQGPILNAVSEPKAMEANANTKELPQPTETQPVANQGQAENSR